MTREELQRVREWAVGKLATGEEPPWAWYQYMKLREVLDAILAGMAATEGSPRLAERPERRLRLVGTNDPPESVPPHQPDQPVQLPM